MDEKNKKQKTNWFVVAAVIFALFALVLIADIVYVATTTSQGTASIANADVALEDDDGAYKLEIENERTEAQVTERHWIYGSDEHVPNQNGGTVDDSTKTGYVTDEYETNPSSEVKKNYHYVEVNVTEETNNNSEAATVDEESGKVNGEMKPTETYVDYYYSINDPKVTTTIEKSGLTSEGTKKVTEEGQSITYTISYEASVDDYIGNGTITIVDTLPYEIETGYTYTVKVNSEVVSCTPVYDEDAKTLTWVIDEVAIDTYGENDTTSSQTIKVEIELTVVYADVNYGAESITNEVSGEIVLEDFPDDPYEAEPDDETIDLNITVEINATKTWIDYSNSYNTRPGTITVNVMRYIDSQTEAQAEVADTKEITITEYNTFDITFEDLPKYDIDGNEYVYYITEDEAQGYTTEIDEDFNIVNTIEQELTEITVNKVWMTDDEVSTLTATINLYRDGVLYDTATITGNSSYTFENLPVYAVSDNNSDATDYDGHKYTYTLEEENVPGYVTTFDEGTNTFTNTMEATGSYTVTKVWVDGENAYNTRPDSINVIVLANGDETEYKATLNGSNSWTYTFEDIELYDEDGHAITFTAVEDEVPNGYDVSYAPTSNGYQITNTISQEQIEISGTKTWIEPDGSTRKYAVFQLYQNGQAVETAYAIEQEDGTYSFTGLDKYDLSTGLEWEYTVQEDYVDGYTTTVDDTGLNFTNTINEGSTYVYGTKTWITPEDKDTLTATIILYQDGIYYTETTVTGDGRYLFSELPQYSQTDGHEYVYTVGEIKVEGYTTVQDGLNFTNTINQEYTSVSGTKTWVTPLDDSNSLTAVIGLYRDDSTEPIQTVAVYGDGSYEFNGLPVYDIENDGHEYTYTVREISCTEGYELTSSTNGNFVNTVEQDEVEVEVSKTWITPLAGDDVNSLQVVIELYQDDVKINETTISGNGSYTFDELDKYAPDGHEYVYTTNEVEAEGYTLTSSEDGNYVNTINQEYITISGTKEWHSEDATSAIQVTFYLYRDDEISPIDSVTITGATGYTFENVEKYDLTDGHEYTYYVVEGQVPGYVTTDDGNGNFVNTETAETSVTVSKTWVDGDNEQGLRTDSVDVTLWAETAVTETVPTEYKVTLSAANNWTYTFENIEAYDEDGRAITYTAVEDEVPGYTTTYNPVNNGYEIVNTITQEEVIIDVSKTWVTPLEGDDINSLVAKIELYRDGDKIDEVTLNGNSSYTFDGLDKYAPDGHEYVYSTEEVEVDSDYQLAIKNGNDYTNQIIQKYTDIAVNKTWITPLTGDDINTLVAEIALYRDGELYTTAYINGNDSYVFDTLPVYAVEDAVKPGEEADGHEYVYTLEEINVPEGYELISSEDGTYVNRVKQDYTKIVGNKTWLTEDDSSDYVATIRLYRDGKDTGITTTVTGDGSYTFDDLEMYDLDDGHEYVYTVSEERVDGYTTTQDGVDFVNLKTDITSITVSKVWHDSDEIENTRQDTVHIILKGNNEEVADVTLPYQDSWEYTFTDLDTYDDQGRTITYTVEEDEVPGYTTDIESTTNGYIVTNTINQDYISVEGTKTWITPEDKGSLTATIELYRDGDYTGLSQTVTGDESYKFTNLDKYDLEDGHIYEYTVKEIAVEGYTTIQNGYNFTNTIEQDTTFVTVSKEWITPYDESELTTTVVLYQDGVVFDSHVLTGNESYTFTNLPVYDVEPDAVNGDGHVFVYTTSEENITEGYHQTSDENGNYVNTIDQEEITISGEKVWLTEDDYSEYQAIINLYRDDEDIPYKQEIVTGNGTYEFVVDKYDLEDGHIYEYTVDEERVDGYETVGPDSDGKFTNTKTGETRIEVTKTWVDDNNAYDYRPQDITVYLVANEIPTGDEVVLSDANDWTATFDNLSAYDDSGVTIKYTVEEVTVDKYTSEIVATSSGYNIVNTIAQEYLDVTVSKEWNSPLENKDSLQAVILLRRDGDTIATATINGDGTYTFENLDKYDLEDGHEYIYTTEELSVTDGYHQTSAENGNYVNTVDQEFTEVTVSKEWITPEDKNTLEVTIDLLRDGVVYRTETLTGNSEFTFTDLPVYDSDDEYGVTGDGHKFVYTTQEHEIEGYDLTGYSNEGNVFSYTNTINQDYVDVVVSKEWNDVDNKYLTRPENITVSLLRDGDVRETVTGTVENGWTYTFENLDKYDLADGHIYEYTVEEAEVQYYTTEIEMLDEDGYEYKITNTYVGPEDEPVIEEDLSKEADTDSITDEHQEIDYDIEYDYTISNYAGKATVTIVDILPAKIDEEASDLDGGTYAETIDNDGNTIYTITWEEDVDVPLSGYTGHIEEHIALVYEEEDVTHDLINDVIATIRTYYLPTDPEHSEDEVKDEFVDEDEADVEQIYKVEVPVVKTWDDTDNAKGHRPTSVTVTLLADGAAAYDYDGEAVPNAVIEGDAWTYTFDNLPKYDDDGNEVVYTVVESETKAGDLEYYNDPEIIYGDEYIEIINSYQMKETDLESEISKTGTELITASRDEVTYTITYNAVIDEYIGEAYLRVVDTLPFGIDVEASDLADGEYDENAHTITWHVDLGHINTNNNGDYEVTFEKTITVVFGDNIEYPLSEMTNEVEAKVYLTENETVNTSEDDTETEVQIPGKVIVKYIDMETGEEISEEIDMDDWVGEDYITDLLDIPNYDFVYSTDNTEGQYIEGTIEVDYYYKKIPGKVIVNYYDEDTGELIAEEVIINGYVGEDYKTELKDIDYYEFVESTDNTEGGFTREDIYVDYYYRKLTFDMSIDKAITGITKDGSKSNMDSTLERVEVGRNDANSTTISVEFRITVTNTEEIRGTATVVDYIPEYFKVSSSNPSYWIENGNTLSVEVTLDPGESVDLTVVLDWVGGDENFGTVSNIASLTNINNPAGFDEVTLDNNSSSATVMLSVRTGLDVDTISYYAMLALCGAALVLMGIIKKPTASESETENNENEEK